MLSLIHIYVKEGGMNYLRAYIDKEGGITVDDCEVVARQMNASWAFVKKIILFCHFYVTMTI